MAKVNRQIEASLIVEAKTPSNIRSSPFQQTWSRLYSANDYFIDLAFDVPNEKAIVRGQVLLPSNSGPIDQGMVKLYLDKKTSLETNLDASGTFAFTLEQTGNYHLIIKLKKNILAVPSIEFL